MIASALPRFFWSRIKDTVILTGLIFGCAGAALVVGLLAGRIPLHPIPEYIVLFAVLLAVPLTLRVLYHLIECVLVYSAREVVFYPVGVRVGILLFAWGRSAFGGGTRVPRSGSLHALDLLTVNSDVTLNISFTTPPRLGRFFGGLGQLSIPVPQGARDTALTVVKTLRPGFFA
jgi:hypothetical protein